MSRFQAMLDRLEQESDRLSPIVVKEVRQLAQGREFHYAFHFALLIGLVVAFFGAADALKGEGSSGRWTFAALSVSLGLLGFVVVPLGAFHALRNERLEQTLELITLTALSPRRVVIGKLMAQAVKLATLFAGLAPFIAMSFLLGGVDFQTILFALLSIFTWSLCASAACLFLSALVRTRAASGVVFGAVAIVALLVMIVFGAPRAVYFVMMRGGVYGPGYGSAAPGGWTSWWTIAASTIFCLSLCVNFVLLAENRLLRPSDNRSTALRLGFLAQLLVIVVSQITEPGETWPNAASSLLIAGTFHLAIVAMFTVTEDLVQPRRARLVRRDLPGWRRVLAPLQPGGGGGAIYVLLQMAALLLVGWAAQAQTSMLHWFLAACGYICFFTGVPAVIFRAVLPAGAAAFRLRIAVFLLVAATIVLPDVLSYLLWQRDGLDLSFSVRHVVNPFRGLANFQSTTTPYRTLIELIGITGVLAYVVLVRISAGVVLDPASADPEDADPAAGEAGRVDALS